MATIGAILAVLLRLVVAGLILFKFVISPAFLLTFRGHWRCIVPDGGIVHRT